MTDQQNSNISANNKRIAKNTLMLYIRMFISMAVSLYTSRVILQTLGVVDYGVYNIVGGVVGMFSFLNSAMAGATSRFLTYEIGKGDQKKLADTFNAAFWVHVAIAAIVFILCETIGLWFLEYKMVIPEERIFAANVVFQLSIISTVIAITQVPYDAALIAHEKMNVYAYVEMVNVFLRLGILYLLIVINMDKLILYGILMLTISTGIMLFYRYYGLSHYHECRVKFEWDWDVIKPMLSFSGLDFYCNMTATARTQGSSMLLNVFFGPVVNAAAGVAVSVQNAVMSFSSNVITALRPQIIKYYAQGDFKSMSSLMNNACKLTFLINALLTVPLCCEMKYVLHLWLENVPDNSSVFCAFALIYGASIHMTWIIHTGNHATGKIYKPSIVNGTVALLVVPLTYVSFKLGCDAWVTYLYSVLAIIFSVFYNGYNVHANIPEYSLIYFMKDVILKCSITVLIGIFMAQTVTTIMPSSFIRLLMTTLSSSLGMGIFGWYFLISKSIRSTIINFIKTRLVKK